MTRNLARNPGQNPRAAGTAAAAANQESF